MNATPSRDELRALAEKIREGDPSDLLVIHNVEQEKLWRGIGMWAGWSAMSEDEKAAYLERHSAAAPAKRAIDMRRDELVAFFMKEENTLTVFRKPGKMTRTTLANGGDIYVRQADWLIRHPEVERMPSDDDRPFDVVYRRVASSTS